MPSQRVGDDMKVIGPYQMNRIILCSADASPASQKERAGDAGYFFPGAKWVGAIRNASQSLGCRFVILTTGHGLVNPDEIIEPYDFHIEKDTTVVAQRWRRTISERLGSSSYEVMVFFAGGCPRDRYVQLMRPILNSLGISLFTYGKPNMFDVGKTVEIVQLMVQGTTLSDIASRVKCPERVKFYSASADD